MDDYLTKFVRPSRFAPYLMPTKEERARKFQKGLRPDVNFTFKIERISTMALVTDKTRIAAEDEDYTKKKREDLGLAKTEEGLSKKQQSQPAKSAPSHSDKSYQ